MNIQTRKPNNIRNFLGAFFKIGEFSENTAGQTFLHAATVKAYVIN